MVVTDQFIDRTWGRPDTFFDARARCSTWSRPTRSTLCCAAAAIDALEAQGEPFAPTGTCVVIQGPRFSTRAESLWFRPRRAHTRST